VLPPRTFRRIPSWRIPLCTCTNASRRRLQEVIRPEPEGFWRRSAVVVEAPANLVIDPFNCTITPAPGGVAETVSASAISARPRSRFYATAQKRAISASTLPEATLAPFITARDAPRLAFLRLIERVHDLRPGTNLVDLVNAPRRLAPPYGALMLGDKVGSIPAIGGWRQVPSCNGLDFFWHIETRRACG